MPAFGPVLVAAPLTSSDPLDFKVDNRNLITNDAAIAANRTYSPLGLYSPGVARWVDRSGGIQVGYPRLDLSIRPPVNGSRINRVLMTAALPTLEQTSASTASGIQPAPTKAYEHFAKMEFFLPERGARWERLALFMTCYSLMQDVISASDGSPLDGTDSPLMGAVLDLEMPY